VTAFRVPNKNTAEMVWVRAPISSAKWLVHRELAPILQHIVTTAEQRGYLFDHGPGDVDDDWGYAYRKIAGSNVWSNHSGGTAVDIDAQEYPQGQLRRQPPSWLIFLFAQWGWSYGGEFGNPDPMHFEFRGTVEKARQLVAMLAASHIKNVPVPVPVGTPSPAFKERVMYLRNKNTGEIFAVGAATFTLLSGSEWAERVKSEGAQAWDCEPLTIYARTVGSGRRRV